MFFLLYKHSDGGVFDDFPKISKHSPKISEDFFDIGLCCLRFAWVVPVCANLTFDCNCKCHGRIIENLLCLSRVENDLSMRVV